MTGIVFGAVVPHPPLLVPQIGRGQEVRVKATGQAMTALAQDLKAAQPQSLLLISPHGASHPDAMGIFRGTESWGNFIEWGAPRLDYHFDNDGELALAIKEEAEALNVPVRDIGSQSYELDHGALVPLFFLQPAIHDVPLVPLTFSWRPLEAHLRFGQALRRAAERLGRRVALIASGDLSHRLIPEAPAGYDPQGEVFDRRIAQAVASLDKDALLGLDPELIERAGECGLRSIAILLGALEGLPAQAKVLSYEGPFGVGYMVASITVTEESKLHPLVRLAKEAAERCVLREPPPPPQELTPEMKEKAGVFVCIKKDGELRGCIGTFEPTRDNVFEEIVANSLCSALQDPRFSPVAPEELPRLTYMVDVLSHPEPISSLEGHDPKRYGLIVEAWGRKGLLLPDLEGVDTAQQQMEICLLKAGLRPRDPVKLYRFQVQRYQ